MIAQNLDIPVINSKFSLQDDYHILPRWNIVFQDHHILPKIKLIMECTSDTAFESYIAETVVPLKWHQTEELKATKWLSHVMTGNTDQGLGEDLPHSQPCDHSQAQETDKLHQKHYSLQDYHTPVM